MTEKDHLQEGKKVLPDKTYLKIHVSDNSQEDVSRFISEVKSSQSVRLSGSDVEMNLGQ